MPTGVVKWFNTARGYGFITPDDGSADTFVHITSVKDSGLKMLVENQRVSFELKEGRDGRDIATQLDLIDQMETLAG
ncbi:MAG: cold-shock protein [Parvibaculales bacterium]